MAAMNALQNLLWPFRTAHTKVRIGSNQDGGYILLRELLDMTGIVYSYGIGGETSFDEECCRLGKQVFMYDPTIDNVPVPMEGMVFQRRPFSEDFPRHVIENGHQNEIDMTLKLDVEGFEWNGLLDCDPLVFGHFAQMVVEFHGMTGSDRQAMIFSHLLQRYAVVHVHANNHMGNELNEWGWPGILEVTFVRQDHLHFVGRENRPYPIAGLDFPNIPEKADYVLDWWLEKKA